MSPSTILVDVDAGVMTITLNRPERRNAWNETMASEMSDALDAAEANGRSIEVQARERDHTVR